MLHKTTNKRSHDELMEMVNVINFIAKETTAT